MIESDNLSGAASVGKLTKMGQPQLSDLIQARRHEQAVATRPVMDTRLSYMTYDDVADDEIYDPTDFITVGNKIRNNVAQAIIQRFPVVGDKYTLTVENLSYEKPKNRKLADEKAIIQQEKSLMDRLSGDWVLYDNATGKVVDKKHATILNVPRMTSRGTFIRNGSELGLKHMFRLRPGIYARVKGDGTPSVHINPAQTTGRQMSLNLDQESGIMTISRGTRNFGVLPLLKAAGVSDDAIKAAWGEDVYKLNYNKYSRLLSNDSQFTEYKKLWDEGFTPIKLDPETTLGTMGKAYTQMSAEVLLGAANKALKLSRTMSVDDEDDRDSLAYQRIMGPADYIPERIVRDGGGLLRKMFQRVVREGNLSSIESGAFQPQVDSVFTEDKHAGYIDGASPFEGLDYSQGVSRIGEGGIGDVKAAPAETRGVNDSYLGFIDPIRCYSKNHKIMTKLGWVPIAEVDLNTEIACLINDTVAYRRPTEIHRYPVTEQLYSYKSKAIAYEVTGNHRMLVCNVPHKGGNKKRGGYQKEYAPSYKVETAAEMHNTNRKVKTAGHQPYPGDSSKIEYDFDFRKYGIRADIWAAFMGWYLSEGSVSISTENSSQVCISQTLNIHPEESEKIAYVLSNMPFDYHRCANDRAFYIKSKELADYLRRFGYCQDKFIPEHLFELPLSCRKAFVEAMMLGDGRRPQGKEGWVFTTTSHKLAAGMERMLFDLGYCVTCHKYVDNREERYLDVYEVRACVAKEGWLIKNGRSVTDRSERSDYYTRIDSPDGFVYCVSVEGETIYTKIDDHKPFWCLNSPESLKVGLEVYLTYGVKKDSKGNLYANFIGKDGKAALRPMSITAKSIIATPEFYSPEADPEEFIPAFYKGKGIEYVQRKDVDFFLASANNMMSIGAGMIPNIGGIRSNRTLMGCLHPDTLLDVYRDGTMLTIPAKHYLTEFRVTDKLICLDNEYMDVELRNVRGVVQVPNYSRRLVVVSTEGHKDAAIVTRNHKFLVSDRDGFTELKLASELSVGDYIPVADYTVDELLHGKDDWCYLDWERIVSLSEEETVYDYAIDIDVNDSVYMLHSGVFTHNSKYPLQALSLDRREVPLVQREITAGGLNTTTEKLVATQCGAKFAPTTGRVIAVSDDEIVIRDRDGNKHSIDLYNMYPANQKGYLHNTPKVEVGDRVHEGDLLADSNYTKDGSAALGVNLKVAFMTGHGAELFEDAIAISESCAKKLASEQLHKFRGDLTSDTSYGKQKFLNLFGTEDYTTDQLDKIDENGMPKIGVKFQKGDPVFLGIQTRDLSTSGLSRNAAVPYVKTWEHDAEGTVIDVVKGRKHMTVYTRSFTPMQLGDKMCYDDKTEIMTKRGWVLFADLLADDEVLTLDIRTGENYFTAFESAFKYRCDKEPLYRLVTKNLDIATTANHKHLVAAMNNARYIDFQTSEQIFGKHRWFITGCNLESTYSFKSSREEGAKERWEKYTGYVYCVTVADTHTVYVRRNGKAVWSGNSNRFGAKATVSAIIPDDEMPRDANGEIYEVLQSPLGLPSRLNPAQLGEMQLAKVAKLTGRPEVVPDFTVSDTIDGYVSKRLAKHGLKETTTVFDPRSNKHIEGISDGYMFYYKLKHMSELKERGRGTGTYSAEEVPMKGEGAARRLGMMETSAVYSGGGMDVLRDAKLIRGQRNDEFWRDYRDGKHPDIPGTPLVHKKFFSHLVAAGAYIDRDDEGFRLSAATDSDMKELTQNRKVTKAATFDSKNMQPIEGGLFDQSIFGADGDMWGYYELPEPVLNPLMFKPIASILGWTDTELREYLQGSRNVDGKYGPEYVMNLLDNVDLKAEMKKAKDLLKSGQGTLQQKDLARKRIRAIHPLLRDGVKPTDLFFTRMPILPPRFRTVSVIQGGETNIAADVNFLYKRMMDAGDDLTAAKAQLPGEYQVDAREALYNAVNAVVGTMPTDDPKLEAKGVGGLLKWAFGKGSPKLSSLHRKVFGSNLDMGGLGTIIPDSRLTIDQVGIPEESAWSMYEPFVVRELRQSGYSMVQAMREVTERSAEAKRELLQVMKKRPVLLNRAPTLWRYGIQAMYPVIVDGRAIRVNPNVCKSYNADFDGNCCDFDSKIFVRLSKSAFDKLYKRDYIISNAKNNQQEDDMSVTENSIVTVKQESGDIRMMSIGEFPKFGEPMKDKNGADVYGLMSGVEVMSVNPVTGEVSFNQATSFTEEHDCECVEITVGGRTATVSTNATLAVFDPQAGKLIKVAASEHNNRLIPILKKLPLPYGNRFDRDFGWWVGALISDGWISDRVVGYTKLEDCKRKEFIRISRKINDNFTVNEYRSEAGENKLGKSVKVHLSGKEFVEMCRSFGIYNEESDIDGRSSLRKQIPYDMLLNGSEEFLWGLLSGLLDGDGSIVSNTSTKNIRFSCRFSTSSPSLRETFEFLLYRLGIRYSTTVTPPRNWSNEAYSITPSTVDMFTVLDKLSCIGEREVSMIEEWKGHAPGQDNTDLIPISEAELQILRKNKLASYNSTLYSALGRSSRSVSRTLAAKHLDYLRPLVPEFVSRIENVNTHWRPVSKIVNVGKREVYDFAIPDTKVFVINAGVTIYDSMTTHVPVSQTAIDAMNKSMLPSKNLLSPKNFKAHFIPRDAANEGLYLASRVGEGRPIRFRTEAEAQAAYDRGEIKIDTPIIIIG